MILIVVWVELQADKDVFGWNLHVIKLLGEQLYIGVEHLKATKFAFEYGIKMINSIIKYSCKLKI